MFWDDNWPYPDSADRDGDGDVDFNERAEYDYMYDSIMGTNMSGFCPENDTDSDYDEDDDEDSFDDDEKDEDELAEEYSDRLDLENITDADWDGYFTSDGTFNDWEIDDMFDYSDDDGFWDKCGNYHEYVPVDDDDEDTGDTDFAETYSDELSLKEITEAAWDGYTTSDGNFHPWEIDNMYESSDDCGFTDKCGKYHEYFSKNDGYWENGEFVSYRNEEQKYCIDGNNNRYLSGFGYWIDGNCYIENKDDSNIMGAIVGGKYYPFESRNDPQLTKIMLEAVEKLQKVQGGHPHYYGFLGYWDNDVFSLFEQNNPDKVIGFVNNNVFTRILRTGCGFRIEEKESVPEESDFNPVKDIDSLFSRKHQFSNSPAGRMFAAAYGKFPELENYLTPKDLEEGFSVLTEKVYSKNRSLAADCWAWIVTNYTDKLLDDPDFDHLTDEYFRFIPGNMSYADDEDRHKFIQHYISERPELMEILFSKVPYDSNNSVPFELLGWSIVRNDFAFFEKAYFMLLNNKRGSVPPEKEDVLDGALTYRESFARNQSSEKFYVFFREEIKTVEHAGKRQHLNDILRHKLSYGFPFAKPSTDLQYNQILQDIPSIKDNVPAENVTAKPRATKKAAFAPQNVPKEKISEEKSTAAEAEKNADIKTELHVLYERKRVLKEMLAEIDMKIEKLESSGVTDDAFFANAEVVGMKYYDCSDGELVIGSKLILVRDEENEYDRNAVAVYDEENRKVGFLTKRTNASIAIGLDNGKELYAKVSSAPIPDHYPNMKVEIWEEK